MKSFSVISILLSVQPTTSKGRYLKCKWCKWHSSLCLRMWLKFRYLYFQRALRKVNKKGFVLGLSCSSLKVFGRLFQWAGKLQSHILILPLKVTQGLEWWPLFFFFLNVLLCCARVGLCIQNNLAGHSFVSSDNATLKAGLQNTFQLAGLLILVSQRDSTGFS